MQQVIRLMFNMFQTTVKKKLRVIKWHFQQQPRTYLALSGMGLVLLFLLLSQIKLPNINPSILSPLKVNLTEEGFSPNPIAIKVGQAVIFTSSRDKPFWPASDLHPTHTIYPEFDPKRPINPNESWSFIFSKSGRWRYHDHLAPEFTGEIIVSDNTSVSPRLDKSMGSNCENLEENQAIECWFNFVEASVKTKGINTTYETMATLFKSNLVFAKNCHAYTHRIGQIGYSLFSEHKDFSLDKNTAFCGYGFYHGFMEALLEKGGSYDQAKSFCDFATTHLSGSASDAGMACYHGIGHGFADYFDPVVYRDPKDIASKTLNLCKKIADNDQKLFRCGSGVFNALALSMGYNKLPLDKKDPLSLCREQTGVFKDACYSDMQVLVLDILSKHDFTEASRYIEAIIDDHDAINSIEVMSSGRTKSILDKSDYSLEVASCRALQERLVHSCVIGIAAGLMEFGEPGQEYVKAVSFCAHSVAENEREDCYKRTLNYSRNIYTREKLKEICATIDEKYRYFCQR